MLAPTHATPLNRLARLGPSLGKWALAERPQDVLVEAEFAERVQLIESEAHAFFDKQLKHFVSLVEVLGCDQAPGRLAEPTCRRKLTCLRNRM